jgi:hypothetical protein
MLVLTGIMLGGVLLVMVGEQAQEMQLAHRLPKTNLPAFGQDRFCGVEVQNAGFLSISPRFGVLARIAGVGEWTPPIAGRPGNDPAEGKTIMKPTHPVWADFSWAKL